MGIVAKKIKVMSRKCRWEILIFRSEILEEDGLNYFLNLETSKNWRHFNASPITNSDPSQ
jgi:hypothetical protein